jgi:hypothetical protein
MALAWTTADASTAFAQFNFGGPQAPPPSKPAAAGPETHAASGAEQLSLPKSEAQLPEDPLAIPEEDAEAIGTNHDPDADAVGENETDEEFQFFGPFWIQKRSGEYRFRSVWPLWAERTQPGERSSLFGPYFQRRGVKSDADVLFPLFWRLRDTEDSGEEVTTIALGPFGHQEAEGTKDVLPTHKNWLAPLFFEGTTTDGGGYLHIPPLLTFTSHSDRDGTNVVGPLFCTWKGGPACDPRTTDSIDMGLAPFYFYGRDRTSEYEVIPPLLHVYRYNDTTGSESNLWGPLYWSRDREGESFHVMPFFWRRWSDDAEHITVAPLFHYGREGNAHRLVTPLFFDAESEDGATTFGSWLYARHRGRTELDMVTPLFWWYRDPDLGEDTKLGLPFFYSSTSPRRDDLAVFPFYGNFKRHGLREDTWVTPLFRHRSSATGWSANLYPLMFVGREYEESHFVVPPIVWDFDSPKKRSTVVFPVFWRFSDDDSVSQVVLNTYFGEKRVRGGSAWEFHLFPAVSFGGTPDGYWWNLLYGLAGYTREGASSKIRALYIPIEI